MLNSLYLLVLGSWIFFNPVTLEDINDCKMEVSTNRVIDSCDTGLEVFKYKTDCKLDYSKTMVFNRWGNQVFEEINSNNGFDGTWKRKDLPSGTYFYNIDYQIKGEPDTLSMKGYLQIER